MQLEEETQKTRYNGFVTKHNNYIWAGAMCLAWEELKNQIIKEPIKLITKNQKSIQIIDNYNTSNFLKKDLSSNCYYVKSGYGNETAKMINKEVSEKFPQMTLPKLNQKFIDTDVIAFAYIFKKFDFLSQFQRRQKANFLFNGQKLESFYAKQQEQKKNVFYFNYDDDQNFLIGIKGKDPNDSICLLKSQKQLSADEVIKTVIHKENNGAKRYLTKFDEFQMPIIKIQANRNLTELQGLRFANQSCINDILSKATEGLKIQINEKGAKMENAAILVKMKAKIEAKKSKRFILNKPFWIVMKQKSKHPYLCLKIMTPVQVASQDKK